MGRHGGFGGVIWWNETSETGPDLSAVTPISTGGIGYGGYGGGSGWAKYSGGASLSGRLWSNQSGFIEISFGAGSMTVWVDQGWNDVNIYYPFIVPTPTWVETNLEIDTHGGYLLIPAGFIIKVKHAPDAPKKEKSPRPVDRLHFKEEFGYNLIHGAQVFEIEQVDDIEVAEEHSYTLIQAPQIFNKEQIDDIEVTEEINYVVHRGPQVIQKQQIDDLTFNEICNYILQQSPESLANNIESVNINEIIDTFINNNV